MKTALVLSGGGAKGAFQAGAIAELHQQGITYDRVVGVSVGVLNGLMVASDQIDEMVTMWETIKREQIYSKRSILGQVLKYVAFKIGVVSPPQSLYSNAPLFELLKNELKNIDLHIPLTAGRVNLETGDYINDIHPGSPDFTKEILASTSIPVVWPPVEIGGQKYVDGGIRNVTPLGDAVKTNPDRIVVITTRMLEEPTAIGLLRSITDIAVRTFDILLDEIFIEDLKRCIQINELVEQAGREGVELTSADGKKLSHYELFIISPAQSLGGTLDFDRNHLKKLLESGRIAAQHCIT